MNVMLKPASQELVITRNLKAPPARVFTAWTDERLSAAWWVPNGCTLLSCELDVREGGAWRRRMRVPDGSVITKHGVYREVVPSERLSFTYNTEYADGRIDPETLVSLTFEPLDGGKTRFTLTHSGFWDEASRVGHSGGWTGAVDRLVAFID